MSVTRKDFIRAVRNATRKALRNTDFFYDDAGIIHPIAGSSGYKESKAYRGKQRPTPLISSQRYLDEDIVEQKRAEKDYDVYYAHIENPDTGEKYRWVVDGHHSLAAAKLDGVSPNMIESDYDYQSEIDSMGFDDFLAAHNDGDEWYDTNTGDNVWS